MVTNVLEVNPQRLWDSLERSAEIGRFRDVGLRRLALSAEDKQLCVEGLKHGERYNINLRAGLPSTVKEGLPKSAEFNVYVRDRKPFAASPRCAISSAFFRALKRARCCGLAPHAAGRSREPRLRSLLGQAAGFSAGHP